MNNIFVITDFNSDTLVRILNTGSSENKFFASDYNQVFQSLTKKDKYNSSFIWTNPKNVISSFNSAIQNKKIKFDECLKEVEAFSKLILDYSKDKDFVFMSSWVHGHENKTNGLLDYKNNVGIQNLISRMNICLADSLNKNQNIYILDTNKWFYSVEKPYSPKMWYTTKVPYTNDLFFEASKDIHSFIDSLRGRSKKLIVLDLDNTLWGGVVGETGWEGINLGGHNFRGEAHVEFQQNLKNLSNRGIQLAIISKNDESVALAAIENHPEMVLKIDDFAGWRINWNDKAENMKELVKEINIGIDSVVFFDDNPVERDRVKSAYPEILVPDLPSDITSYSSILKGMRCFNLPSVTDEDLNRTKMYSSEIKRKKAEDQISSRADWLSSLNTKMIVDTINESNIQRVTQLFNKTNQLNLTTRRLSETKIRSLSNKEDSKILCITVSDKFGELGLVGIIGLNFDGKVGFVSDFILSCRAMGREIEKSMFYIIKNTLDDMGASKILIEYIPTERNRPTLEVIQEIGFEEEKENIYILSMPSSELKSNFIKIEYSY